MSEAPVYVPPFVPASRHVGVPMRAAQASDDELGDAPDLDVDGDVDGDAPGDDSTEVPAARVREGLPSSYRMRHEPHYVDALVGRTVPVARSTAAVQPPPVTAEPPMPAPIPGPVHTVPVAALAVAATALADAFDAIYSALRDLPTRGRPLRDRVAIELALAEATRGRWLADAAVVMQADPMPALDEVDLTRVLRLVIEALGPESRLSGGAAVLAVPDGVCPVFGDERLLTTAVGAAVAAMRAVIEDRGDARRMTVALAPRRAAETRTIEIAQTAVRVPPSALARFFDASWSQHPAGAHGALMLAAAQRIAVAHGGSLDIGPLDGGGCCLMLSVPAAD